jgi:hypothetical protein
MKERVIEGDTIKFFHISTVKKFIRLEQQIYQVIGVIFFLEFVINHFVGHFKMHKKEKSNVMSCKIDVSSIHGVNGKILGCTCSCLLPAFFAAL